LFVFVRSPLGALVTGLVTIGIFAASYFLIIEPAFDRADKTVQESQEDTKDILKESQETIREGNKRSNKAQKLADCLTKAGADTERIARCQAKYQ
jgi:hypothetical protein